MSDPTELVVLDSLAEAKEIFTLHDAGRVHTAKFRV